MGQQCQGRRSGATELTVIIMPRPWKLFSSIPNTRGGSEGPLPRPLVPSPPQQEPLQGVRAGLPRFRSSPEAALRHPLQQLSFGSLRPARPGANSPGRRSVKTFQPSQWNRRGRTYRNTGQRSHQVCSFGRHVRERS